MGAKKKSQSMTKIHEDTFSDTLGTYSVERLISWVQDNHEMWFEAPTEAFISILGSKAWPMPDQDPVANIEFIMEDKSQRRDILSADLRSPVVLKSDGTLIYGLNIIYKAISEGVDTLLGVNVDQSELNDFIIQGSPFPNTGEELPIPDRYIQVPKDRLPKKKSRRREVIETYFADQLPSPVKNKEGWLIRLERPQGMYGCYQFDPSLDAGLQWWKPGTSVEDIPFEKKFWDSGLIAIEDQWMPLSWSRYFQKLGEIPDEIILIHLDDHQDLMMPRMGTRIDGGLYDFVTGNSVYLDDPESVEAAILSGAIGKGSILTPLLWSVDKIHVRHLAFRPHPNTYYQIEKKCFPDGILSVRDNRIGVELKPTNKEDLSSFSSYVVSPDPDTCFDGLPEGVPILFHVDMDYFNNRFDGNSDWDETNPRDHNPSKEEQAEAVRRAIGALSEKGLAERVVDTCIGISPSFFPGEYWQSITELLVGECQRAGIQVSRDSIS